MGLKNNEKTRITGCLYYGCGVGRMEWSAPHPYVHRRLMMNTKKSMEGMTVEELKKELDFMKECLRDEEERYSFTFNKCSLHIGGQQAVALQEEHEEKRREYREGIKQIEELLRSRNV